MEVYHVLNRGVEKRSIVQDDKDRLRFVHDLWEFNDIDPVNNLTYHLRNADIQSKDVGRPYILERRERQPLVDIHAWCLMGNHYHLLLSERVEGGISEFLKKLNGGYAKYFNERYSRSGSLWQGKTKKKLIDNEAYFLHILFYIHLNPLDFAKGCHQWRSRQISNARTAFNHLQGYRWSSHLDYLGKQNFGSIINRELFKEVFPKYDYEIQRYLREIAFDTIEHLALE